MTGTRKPLYPIAEAAALLGLSKGSLARLVESGGIAAGDVVMIGSKAMIRGDYIFRGRGRAGPDAGENARGERLLETVRGELLRALEAAPQFGSCGITITFHSGEISRIDVGQSITRKVKPEPAAPKEEGQDGQVCDA